MQLKTEEQIIAEQTNCTAQEMKFISTFELHAEEISKMMRVASEQFAEWVRMNTVADGAPLYYHIGTKQRKTYSQLYDLYLNDLKK